MSENQSGPGNEAFDQNPESGAPAGGDYPTAQPPQVPAGSEQPTQPQPYGQPPQPQPQPYGQQPPAQPYGQQPQPGATTPMPVPAAPPPAHGVPAYSHPQLLPPPPGVQPSPWAPTGAYPPGSPAWHPEAVQPGTTLSGHKAQPWRRWAAGGAAALVLALAAGGIGGWVGYSLHNNNGFQSAVSTSGNAPIVDRSSLASIAAKVQPEVVVIDTGTAEGSGVIITSDGYIVTNNHVVASGNGSTVTVTFNSGKKVTANVVGTDPKTDLAVVKAPVTGLSPATWGNSDQVNVGDTVLAIGSPLGLQGSVTAGIVSALHRTIQEGGDQSNPFQQATPTTTIGDAIQTDAPINPGNSGGALVNTAGQVIGINSAIATGDSSSGGNIGVGFAISSNKAQQVANELMKGQKVSHPYIGVGVGDGPNGGAAVQSVVAGSPAAKAGVQQGDVITQVNGKDLANSEDLVGIVQSATVGQQLSLTISRNGSTQTVNVTVGESP